MAKRQALTGTSKVQVAKEPMRGDKTMRHARTFLSHPARAQRASSRRPLAANLSESDHCYRLCVITRRIHAPHAQASVQAARIF